MISVKQKKWVFYYQNCQVLETFSFLSKSKGSFSILNHLFVNVLQLPLWWQPQQSQAEGAGPQILLLIGQCLTSLSSQAWENLQQHEIKRNCSRSLFSCNVDCKTLFLCNVDCEARHPIIYRTSSDFHNSNLFSEHLGTHCMLELWPQPM